MDAAAVCARERFVQNVGGEAQARAIVSFSSGMTDAVLAAGREEQHNRRVADESAAANVLDEDTAVRHDDVVIRGGFGSPAPRLVRAAADARDLD
jgi:hypothetical protein